MSWIVERLIIDSDKIKNTEEFDSDLYLDLVSVESKINTLKNRGYISNIELKILKYMMSGYSISATAKKIGISRATVSMIFKNVCTRIAFHLGSQFTDYGYLEHLKQKYNLTEKQIEKAKRYMSGRYRHAFTRRF